MGSCIFRDEPCDPVSCDACYVWSLTINVSRAVPRLSARPLRSAEYIAGLRAGAPYLPVDPASPRPLIQYQRLACLLVLVRAGAGRPHGRPLGPSQSHLALHAWLWVVPPLAVSPYPRRTCTLPFETRIPDLTSIWRVLLTYSLTHLLSLTDSTPIIS